MKDGILELTWPEGKGRACTGKIVRLNERRGDGMDELKSSEGGLGKERVRYRNGNEGTRH